MADRQGFRLERSRRRDPRALDYGGYQLVDVIGGTIIFGETYGRGYGATLDQIEEALTVGIRPLSGPDS